MPKTTKTIPLQTMAQMFGSGIAIARATAKELNSYDEAAHIHRDDYHLFALLEEGTASFEIDFQKHQVVPRTLIYIHPHQVHVMGSFQNVSATMLAINNENLHSEYQKLLDEIAPVRPLILEEKAFSIISDAAVFCLKCLERNQEKLYTSILRDSCHALIGLIIEQFLSQKKPSEPLPRYEVVFKAFKSTLERNFISAKTPKEYAEQLNISVAYLNECVKNTTGYPVSYHIQQRVVLEAKRLLFHTAKSVKEIATELGYDDYPYFSRLFVKVTGMTALTFRNKNHE